MRASEFSFIHSMGDGIWLFSIAPSLQLWANCNIVCYTNNGDARLLRWTLIRSRMSNKINLSIFRETDEILNSSADRNFMHKVLCIQILPMMFSF